MPAQGTPKTPPANTGAELVDIPNRDFFVRENKADLNPTGPYPFLTADDRARTLSFENDSGISEVITFVGSRKGDPIVDPPRLFVVNQYIRGKHTLSGRVAQYHSDNGLPPRVGVFPK